VVIEREGCMQGAIKRDSKSFGKRGIAIARPPSVIDQHVGSHSLCLCVGICMGVGGWEREREGETKEIFCPQDLN